MSSCLRKPETWPVILSIHWRREIKLYSGHCCAVENSIFSVFYFVHTIKLFIHESWISSQNGNYFIKQTAPFLSLSLTLHFRVENNKSVSFFISVQVTFSTLLDILYFSWTILWMWSLSVHLKDCLCWKNSLENYLSEHSSTTLLYARSIMVFCSGKLCRDLSTVSLC